MNHEIYTNYDYAIINYTYDTDYLFIRIPNYQY